MFFIKISFSSDRIFAIMIENVDLRFFSACPRAVIIAIGFACFTASTNLS
jgi:hypothetical protein